MAIAIKNHLPFQREIGIINHESTWCTVQFNDTSLLIGAIYRCPGAPDEYLSQVHDYLQSMTNSRTKIILTGDFNLPDINWDELTVGTKEKQSSEQLLDILFSFALLQIVKEPTRVQGNTSSVLDLALVSGSLSTNISIDDGISDHKILVLTVRSSDMGTSNRIKPSRIEIRDYNRAADESVIDYLEEELDNFSMESCGSVNELWLKLKEAVMHCERSFIPMKSKRIRNMSPWITRPIIHLKRKLKRMRNKRNTSKDIPELSRALKLEVRTARKNFFSNTLVNFMKNQPQKFWRYLSKPEDRAGKLEIGGSMVTNGRIIANTFNNYFQSVFTRSPRTSTPLAEPTTVMPEILITEAGILNLLLKIDTKKAPGPDNISNMFLRRYAQQLTPFLHIIFTESLSTATLPTDWLRAKVTPIHKDGKKTQVDKYRPISLTSCCCKLFEHIINKEIMTHLEQNNLLSPMQHGFRKGLSTVTQLLEITKDFASAINDRSQIDAIFIDFSKAYDRVVHFKLIEKLRSAGIESKLLDWITAYLCNRTQYVTVNNTNSDLLEVYSGVPQGSVLGPLLFLIYINDVVNCVEEGVKVRLFADDLVVYTCVRGTDDQKLLDASLDKIAQWCVTWGMEINVSKTKCMTISHKKSPIAFNYKMAGSDVTRTDSLKYLGVTITGNLKWNVHIENTCKKAYKTLGFLRRKLAAAPATVKLAAYKTLVRPILEYGSIVWNPHQIYLTDMLERIQNKALRFIYSRYSRNDSVTALRNAAGIPTLACRRRVAAVKFLFLLYNDRLNIDKHEHLKPPHRHSRRVSHDKHIRQYATRCDTFKFSFFPASIEIWNALPQEIIGIDSVDSFVERVEEYFCTL